MTARPFSRPVPPGDLDRVRAVAAGAVPPARPRPAATVALIRDGAGGGGGLEVYLMRRVRGMAFAANMHVFPGGSVEPTETVAAAAVRETEEECGVVLDEDVLVPLAHWVTPELEPRRYDTHFFLAALPAGQECRESGTEADLRLWIRPAQVHARGLAVMPPTAAVLDDLARFDTVAAALAQPREIVTVLPVMALSGDRLELHVPGGAAT